MRFKDFLKEEPSIEVHVSDELPGDIHQALNNRFSIDIDDLIITPEVGIQKVRGILLAYGIDIPVIFDIHEEADEIVIQLKDNINLYIVYYLTDSGLYDFHAEIVDDEELDEILEDNDEFGDEYEEQ